LSNQQKHGRHQQTATSRHGTVKRCFNLIFKQQSNHSDRHRRDNDHRDQAKILPQFQQILKVDNGNRKQRAEVQRHIHRHALQPVW